MRSIRNLFLALVAATVLAVPAVSFEEPPKKAPVPVKLEKKDVPQYLQDISVTIATPRGTGSGVYYVTSDGQVWVWTCAHVVESLRAERTSPDKKTLVEFNDAKVVKFITEEGRKVGETSFDAEVIRYSDATHGEDLALLRLRTKRVKPLNSVKFYLDNEIPPIGTELYHCGSLLGNLGSNSLTAGIVSQHGRVLFNDKTFDQTTCTAFPGSSGGAVVLKDDGRYMGMLVRGAGEQFNLVVPVRRMTAWAKKQKIEFAMDPSKEVPNDDELRKLPTDDGMSLNKGYDQAGAKPPQPQNPPHVAPHVVPFVPGPVFRIPVIR